MVGICGGFTTFSSFSLQTLELLQSGEVLWAGGYILGSVALCLLGVWAGARLAMVDVHAHIKPVSALIPHLPSARVQCGIRTDAGCPRDETALHGVRTSPATGIARSRRER